MDSFIYEAMMQSSTSAVDEDRKLFEDRKRMLEFIKRAKPIEASVSVNGATATFEIDQGKDEYGMPLQGTLDIRVMATVEKTTSEAFNTNVTAFNEWDTDNETPMTVTVEVPDRIGMEMVAKDARTFRLIAPVSSLTQFTVKLFPSDNPDAYRMTVTADGYFYPRT